MSKPFVRSSNNRVLGGVFGGIADYFGWDSSLVRLGGAMLIFFYQGLILLYLLAAIFLKSGYTSPPLPGQSQGLKSFDDFLHKAATSKQVPLYLGIFLVILSIAFISRRVGNLFIFRFGSWGQEIFSIIWPLLQLAAVIGLILYWVKRKKR